MADEIHFFELNTGAKVPSIGIGNYAVNGNTVTTAVKVGYRHIDCASMYDNEKEIGFALKELFDDGIVKREDLWITSKLWCTDLLTEDVPQALNKALQDLQLDNVHLFLEKLIRGSELVHETYGVCRTLEELWDGEI